MRNFEWFIYPRLPQSASATTRKPEKIFRCLRVATRPSMNFGQENSCSNYFCVVLLFLTFSCLSDSVISTPIIWLLCCALELERLRTVWSSNICFCVQCAMLSDTLMSWKKTSDFSDQVLKKSWIVPCSDERWPQKVLWKAKCLRAPWRPKWLQLNFVK